MEELVTRRDWARDSQVLIFISCDKKQNPHNHSPPSAPLSTGIVPQSHTEQASRKPLSSTGSSSSLRMIFDEYEGKKDGVQTEDTLANGGQRKSRRLI